MLEALVASCNGRPIPIRTYSYEELEQATDYYDNCRQLHRPSSHSYYHGEFEGRTISVKIYPTDSFWHSKHIITDLAISAKMSRHKNVLRLLGCCLETQLPTLVVECVKDETLADRIYAFNSKGSPRQRQSMAWESRLRVARDIAHAVAYLHTGFSIAIIHRDIKPENILFDKHDIPKLSEFMLAISIPEGETHVDVAFEGTCGYACPNYVSTGRITEKTDVYSFGVILLELLTGQPGSSHSRADGRHVLLVNYVLERGIDEIVDPGILTGERGASMQQQLQAVLDLALICVDEDPERRPTMVHVTKELRRIERPSTFAQAAEPRRLPAAKEKELANCEPICRLGHSLIFTHLREMSACM